MPYGLNPTMTESSSVLMNKKLVQFNWNDTFSSGDTQCRLYSFVLFLFNKLFFIFFPVDFILNTRKYCSIRIQMMYVHVYGCKQCSHIDDININYKICYIFIFLGPYTRKMQYTSVRQQMQTDRGTLNFLKTPQCVTSAE